MFTVTVSRYYAYLTTPTAPVADCPDSGLASVDFLRAAGLPERSDGRVELPGIERPEQEPLCRQFAARLDSRADLHAEIPQHAEIPAPLAVEWLAIAAGAPLTADFVGRVIALAEAAEAEKAAAEAAAAAEKAAEREAAAAECAARKEREAAAEAAAHSTLREWVQQHGSELLRARLAHEADGVEWIALAEQEWADAAVAPLGESIDDPYEREDVTGRVERTTPTLAELRRLDEARAMLTAACKVSLWWASGDDIYPFTALCVGVTTPTGREVERWFAM